MKFDMHIKNVRNMNFNGYIFKIYSNVNFLSECCKIIFSGFQLVSLTGKVFDGWIRDQGSISVYTKNRLMSWSNDK